MGNSVRSELSRKRFDPTLGIDFFSTLLIMGRASPICHHHVRECRRANTLAPSRGVNPPPLLGYMSKPHI